ncbi:MAG: hypothetical protein HQ547_01730 [Candidatus Omnitrophica bacterium]|nr:hypothetical protein [Candidatus Omnitrophota bacterium]
MKRVMLLCLSIVLLFNQYAHATTQRSDDLIYDGKTYQVWGFTLSDKMTENKIIFFDKPEYPSKGVMVTSNWDGIGVSLVVKNNKLYVMKIDLDIWAEKSAEMPPYKDVFGIDIPKQGLFADWYSGELITEPWSWHRNESSHTFFFENGVLKEVKKGPVQE